MQSRRTIRPGEVRRRGRRPGPRPLHSVMLLLLCFNATLGAAQPAGREGATVRVLDTNGTPLPGAVVFVGANTAASAGRSAGPTHAIDQRSKRFDPFVSVARPGDVVSFPNSDDIRHHVYSFSDGNAFERKLYRANEADPVTFSSPGVVALGCNIHDNMQAFVLVTDEPVQGVSGDDGAVAGWRADVGARVRVWHPFLNNEGEVGEYTVSADPRPRPRPGALRVRAGRYRVPTRGAARSSGCR